MSDAAIGALVGMLLGVLIIALAILDEKLRNRFRRKKKELDAYLNKDLPAREDWPGRNQGWP